MMDDGQAGFNIDIKEEEPPVEKDVNSFQDPSTSQAQLSAPQLDCEKVADEHQTTTEEVNVLKMAAAPDEEEKPPPPPHFSTLKSEEEGEEAEEGICDDSEGTSNPETAESSGGEDLLTVLKSKANLHLQFGPSQLGFSTAGSGVTSSRGLEEVLERTRMSSASPPSSFLSGRSRSLHTRRLMPKNPTNINISPNATETSLLPSSTSTYSFFRYCVGRPKLGEPGRPGTRDLENTLARLEEQDQR